MDESTLIIKLQQTFINNQLPGIAAQDIMRPASRDRYDRFNTKSLKFRPAAVLILLHKIEDNWHFILIERTDCGDSHSGQIALPGGKVDSTESFEMAALRECEEEIGISSSSIKVLGKLTNLPIPVSKFMVTPFIGYVDHLPKLIKNDNEVKTIFHISIEQLINRESKKNEMRIFEEKEYDIPYFYLANQKVWGATAMILSELRELILLIESS